ncbi:MAG: hypothetical protein AAF250_11345 [Pseudomonadota bacterium]
MALSGSRILRGSALLVSLCLAAPAAAQFEITYPDEPPKEGQTLLEWARPPILDYTIPADQRDDVSDCGETFEYDLDKTALTCWPVLRAAQLFLLAEYAAGEPSGDKAANLHKGIALADDAIEFIGEPQWPLQEYLLIKAREVKLNSLMKLGEWDDAYDTSLQLVSTIKNDLFQFDEFRLAYAHRKRGQVFLELGLYDGAKFVLEDARALLEGFDGEKVALPFSDHSEDMIAHAISAGDLGYAEEMTDRYLGHIRTSPKGMQFGYRNHLDLKLYLVAARGDAQAALALLDERFADEQSYARCSDGPFKFPSVLAPLRSEPAIIERLREGGCKVADIAGLETAAKWGIVNRSGEVILPYPDMSEK